MQNKNLFFQNLIIQNRFISSELIYDSEQKVRHFV